MAWTYNDYEEQTTDALRLTRLRAHITEVQQQIQANLTSGGDSKANEVLERYLANTLTPRRRELEERVGTLDAESPRVRSAFIRGVPK